MKQVWSKNRISVFHREHILSERLNTHHTQDSGAGSHIYVLCTAAWAHLGDYQKCRISGPISGPLHQLEGWLAPHDNPAPGGGGDVAPLEGPEASAF